MKSPGLTGRGLGILPGSSVVEVTGIPGVAVKCVEIRRNTYGESRLLGQY